MSILTIVEGHREMSVWQKNFLVFWFSPPLLCFSKHLLYLNKYCLVEFELKYSSCLSYILYIDYLEFCYVSFTFKSYLVLIQVFLHSESSFVLHSSLWIEIICPCPSASYFIFSKTTSSKGNTFSYLNSITSTKLKTISFVFTGIMSFWYYNE